jgi:hypothetical protein
MTREDPIYGKIGDKKMCATFLFSALCCALILYSLMFLPINQCCGSGSVSFWVSRIQSRVSIKRNWIRIACVSLVHLQISVLFFRYFSLLFASLQLSYFRFEAKRKENLFFRFKINSSSTLIHIFKMIHTLIDMPV